MSNSMTWVKLEIKFTGSWAKISEVTGVASPLVLCGHRHIAMNLRRVVTAKREAQAFWEVQGHGSKEVSKFLGAWNSISCILRAILPSSDVALPQEPTPDTVSENTSVAHQVL